MFQSPGTIRRYLTQRPQEWHQHSKHSLGGIIIEKDSGDAVDQIPYRPYEFSDITVPYTFKRPGEYLVILQTRIAGDDKYQAAPLQASFDINVDDSVMQGVPLDELMLLYVAPAAIAIAGIAIYLHSRKKR